MPNFDFASQNNIMLAWEALQAAVLEEDTNANQIITAAAKLALALRTFCISQHYLDYNQEDYYKCIMQLSAAKPLTVQKHQLEKIGLIWNSFFHYSDELYKIECRTNLTPIQKHHLEQLRETSFLASKMTLPQSILHHTLQCVVMDEENTDIAITEDFSIPERFLTEMEASEDYFIHIMKDLIRNLSHYIELHPYVTFLHDRQRVVKQLLFKADELLTQHDCTTYERLADMDSYISQLDHKKKGELHDIIEDFRRKVPPKSCQSVLDSAYVKSHLSDDDLQEEIHNILTVSLDNIENDNPNFFTKIINLFRSLFASFSYSSSKHQDNRTDHDSIQH